MSVTLTFSKPRQEKGKKFTLTPEALKALQKLFIGSRLYNLTEMSGIVDKKIGNHLVLIIRCGVDLLSDADGVLREINRYPEDAMTDFNLLKTMLVHYLGDGFLHLDTKTDFSKRSIYFHEDRSPNTVGIIHLGGTRDFNLQFNKDRKFVGNRISLSPGLRHGDICLFSEAPPSSFVVYYSLDITREENQNRRLCKRPLPKPPVILTKTAKVPDVVCPILIQQSVTIGTLLK